MTRVIPAGAAVVASLFALAACSDTSAPGGDCSGQGAAVEIVATGASTFSPASATIEAGQSVCWENDGTETHTVTSDAGSLFDVNLGVNSVFIRTFEAAGSFPYHCELHEGMVGTITVE